MNRHPQRGFSLIELMVTVAIIAVMLAIGVPSFGTSVRAARERTVVQRMTQDFMWVRGTAGAATTTAAQVKIFADCHWTTTINGAADDKHSMTALQVSAQAPGVSCSGIGMALPATFDFNPQGFVSTTGTLQFIGTANPAALKFEILYSGAMFRANGTS